MESAWRRDFLIAAAIWFAVSSVLAAHFAVAGNAAFPVVFLWVSAQTGSWLMIGAGIVGLVRATSRFSLPGMVLIHAAAALAAAVIQPGLQLLGMGLLAQVQVPMVFSDPGPWSIALPRMIQAKLPANLASYAGLAVVARLLVMQRRWHTESIRATRLESVARDAELKALQARLQPHFLFNALHSVVALIDDDPAAAKLVLERLAQLLRLTLERSGSEQIELKDELAWVGAYLAIERTRFEERLEVCVEVPGEILREHVPALVLQPLVENAIKHGIAPSESGGTILVRATKDERRLNLEVETRTNASFRGGAPGMGIGLDATRSRLLLLYPRESEMEVVNIEGLHRVTLRIPRQERIS